MTEYLLLSLGAICVTAGVIGSVLPALPGPPLSYVGLLLLHWTRFGRFSVGTLIIWGIIIVIVTIFDSVVPVWGAREFGGTRAGVWGSAIGLVIGVVLLPMMGIMLGPFGLLGILGCPFIGALIGEMCAGRGSKNAARAAIGSFIGFIAGTFMKVAVSVVIAVYFFMAFFKAVF
ncbi:MAG: DUF456 domain-containing protein [Deltaproteobacteria bacterium]|nr:DUF456 domain-containing protein [Deltaproteobacteria bacterium]